MALHRNVVPTEPTPDPKTRGEELLNTLDEQLNELIDLCKELQRENSRLIGDRENWLVEKQELVSKCGLAEQGIDKAISRLETLVKEQK